MFEEWEEENDPFEPKDTPWRDSVWVEKHGRIFRFRNCECVNTVHTFRLMGAEEWKQEQRQLHVIVRRVLEYRPCKYGTRKDAYWRGRIWSWGELDVAEDIDGQPGLSDPDRLTRKDSYEDDPFRDIVVVGVGYKPRGVGYSSDKDPQVVEECSEEEAIRRVRTQYDDPHPDFTAAVAPEDKDLNELRSYAYLQCVDCGAISKDSPSLDAERYPVRPSPSLNEYDVFERGKRRLRKEYFWPTYNAYLKSDQWAGKRDKVFARANGQCEACLDADADEVHHLTYDHVFDEPLFDLVAVCQPCHERVTEMDRERRHGSR